MKRLIAFGILALSCTTASAGGTVAGSRHDFSVTGPGQFRAVSETNPCVFCHVSHRGGERVLSNRPDVGNKHTPYESTTMVTPRSMPTGASRLCLSCHDGTIAIGKTRRGSIQMAGGSGPIPASRKSNLGTDLRGTHPVSITPIPSGSVRLPAGGDAVHLDEAGRVQCTSCHDPHDEFRDPVVGKFLVKRNDGSAICVSCHVLGSTSGSASHLRQRSAPTKTLAALPSSDARSDETPCGTCHTQHGGEKTGRLLRPERSGDDLCLGCHGERDARPIKPDLAKVAAHPMDLDRRHDAGEGPDAPVTRRLPEQSIGSPRHVACVDCHNPHASSGSPSLPPRGGGALAGVWGIDIDGKRVEEARYEYEICLKCHGDSANKPQDYEGHDADGVRRARPDANLRLVFAATAVSFHPVAQPGRAAAVPSLKQPLTPASLILCTDCHDSDSARSAGGSGSNGPHGSIHPHLLAASYQTRDLTPESPVAYALCYKCHDREVLLSPRSSFPAHRRHVVDFGSPCSACHDAHGVSDDRNPERLGAHLIQFDLSIVRQSRTGSLRYESAGEARGSCALSCHGQQHGPGEKASSGLEAWSY